MKFQFSAIKSSVESGSKLLLVIMSTMISDSLENIRKKKKDPMDEKSLWLEAPAASEILRLLFLLFEGSRAPIFAWRWAMGG